MISYVGLRANRLEAIGEHRFLNESAGKPTGDWTVGEALRALRQLLDEKDPKKALGGLRMVLTPEGHFLWLCAAHAKEYQL